MNIQQWLLDEKIATHWKQADNIIVGLKLGELYSEGKFEEIKTRAKLYRDIRNTGEKSKVAFEKAIAGKSVPAPLFEGVLHSDYKLEPISQCNVCKHLAWSNDTMGMIPEGTWYPYCNQGLDLLIYTKHTSCAIFKPNEQSQPSVVRGLLEDKE